jgi:alpha-glucosidase
MGSSLGGLVSYYAILNTLKCSESGIFSPSFWFSDKIFDLTENTKK